MKDVFTKEIMIPFSKKTILFLSVWIVSYVIMDNFSNSYSADVVFQALALTILIVFVWNKISKKYL